MFNEISECDPLKSENEIFGERLKRAGAFSVEVSLLERAGHIESLLSERLATKVALKGYAELVDFIKLCHEKPPSMSSSPHCYKEPHIFKEISDYF